MDKPQDLMKQCQSRAKFMLALLLAAGMGSVHAKEAGNPEIRQENFGTTKDGRNVELFTLSNAKGMSIQVCEFGAILASVKAPDKDGKVAELTYGHDTLPAWEADTNYFGATVGRFANRIANGKFTLDGTEYTLALNNDPGGIQCSLHGGKVGFNKRLWHGEKVEKPGATGVKLSYTSPDGEEGYPGTVEVHVTYWLTNDNEVIMDAVATTDKATPLNIANHAYWNLSGDPGSSILDHEMQIFADHYLPTNAGLIPTGELAPVKGTPLDFTRPHAIGERIKEDFEALKLAGGYDHAWVLRQEGGDADGVRLAVRLRDPKSGRVLEVYGNQPAIQFYSGNFLDGKTSIGRGGMAYPRNSAVALESEGFPDAPNQADFPNSILRPGKSYHHKMIYKLRTE